MRFSVAGNSIRAPRAYAHPSHLKANPINPMDLHWVKPLMSVAGQNTPQAARRLLPVYPYEPTNWRFVCTSRLGHNLTWPEKDERPPPGGRQLARTLAIRARSGDRDSALLSAAARWPVDSPLQIKLGCLRRFSFGRSIGNTVRGSPNAVAAPATVSGEPSSKATGPAGLGRRRQAATREPGDLPSVVVTREHIGRGVLMSVELSSS